MDIPSRNVTDENRPAVEELIQMMESGAMEMAPLPCPCGEEDDVQVADRDRWGIPITVKLCQNCGLVRTDPYFTEEALETFYKDFYRKIDIMYDEDEWTEHEHKDLVAILNDIRILVGPAPQGSTILEIGCGLGGGVKWLTEQGYNAIGIDVNVEDARRIYPDLTFTDDWEEYVGQADYVVLVHVFEHFRDPIGTAKKISRLLKDDGLLILQVPGLSSIFSTYHSVFQQYLVCSHPFHYILGTLAPILNRAGFVCLAGSEYGLALFKYGEERLGEWPGAVQQAGTFIELARVTRGIRESEYMMMLHKTLNDQKQQIQERMDEKDLG